MTELVAVTVISEVKQVAHCLVMVHLLLLRNVVLGKCIAGVLVSMNFIIAVIVCSMVFIATLEIDHVHQVVVSTIMMIIALIVDTSLINDIWLILDLSLRSALLLWLLVKLLRLTHSSNVDHYIRWLLGVKFILVID
jgi:hypothetical protein